MTLRPWELSRRGEDVGQVANPVDDHPDALEAEVLANELGGEADIDGRMFWCISLLREGRPTEARAVLAPALGEEAWAIVQVLDMFAASLEGEGPNIEQIKSAVDELLDSSDRDVPSLWMVLGRLFVERGAEDLARRAYDRASAAYTAEDDIRGWASALREAAFLAAGRGDLAAARKLLDKALERISKRDSLRLIILLDQARLSGFKAAWTECIALLETARIVADETLPPDHELVAHTLVSLAGVKMEVGDLGDETEALLTRAHGILRTPGGELTLAAAEAMLLLGELYRLKSDLKAALPLIARAALAYEPIDPKGAAHAYTIWSRALEAAGMPAEAKAKQSRAQALLKKIPPADAP